MNLEQERIDILTQAAEGREREVMQYQINIDNFARAIAEVEANHAHEPHMVEFANHMRDLHNSSLIEQAKERLLLKVIRDQLEEAACMSS